MSTYNLLVAFVLFCIGASCSVQAQNASAPTVCPPPGFDSVKPFDLKRYISAPWYIQKQIPVVYQTINQLYCVRAEYKPIDPTDLNKGVEVLNYANEGKVNGPVQTTQNGQGGPPFLRNVQLIATIPDPADPSKLEVGFARQGTTQQIFPGPYWVVAIDQANYDWAIVVGGPPQQKLSNGCGYPSGPVNGAGFWLFSRKPVDPAATKIMEAKAKELGLDTSVLLPVEQKGCKYQG